MNLTASTGYVALVPAAIKEAWALLTGADDMQMLPVLLRLHRRMHVKVSARFGTKTTRRCVAHPCAHVVRFTVRADS
jgi:hypothetical protein